jgi:hypothetical protein
LKYIHLAIISNGNRADESLEDGMSTPLRDKALYIAQTLRKASDDQSRMLSHGNPDGVKTVDARSEMAAQMAEIVVELCDMVGEPGPRRKWWAWR